MPRSRRSSRRSASSCRAISIPRRSSAKPPHWCPPGHSFEMSIQEQAATLDDRRPVVRGRASAVECVRDVCRVHGRHRARRLRVLALSAQPERRRTKASTSCCTSRMSARIPVAITFRDGASTGSIWRSATCRSCIASTRRPMRALRSSPSAMPPRITADTSSRFRATRCRSSPGRAVTTRCGRPTSPGPPVTPDAFATKREDRDPRARARPPIWLRPRAKRRPRPACRPTFTS